MPFRLRTFGGLSLTGESGPVTGAATQRRKLALLAVLATAGERGVSRDRLLALFWPESDAERARHSLTQSLFALRRELDAAGFAGLGGVLLRPFDLRFDLFDLGFRQGNDSHGGSDDAIEHVFAEAGRGARRYLAAVIDAALDLRPDERATAGRAVEEATV